MKKEIVSRIEALERGGINLDLSIIQKKAAIEGIYKLSDQELELFLSDSCKKDGIDFYKLYTDELKIIALDDKIGLEKLRQQYPYIRENNQ